MLKSERQFAADFSEQTDRWIDEQAERTGRPRAAVIRTVAEEGARAWRFPGISFKGDADSRRAWVTGTGLDVWEMIMLYQDVGSVEGIVADWNVTTANVRVALAYYEEYRDEIDRLLLENEMAGEEIQKRYPTVLIDE